MESLNGIHWEVDEEEIKCSYCHNNSTSSVESFLEEGVEIFYCDDHQEKANEEAYY